MYICIEINARMPDCLASGQASDGIKKTKDALADPVLD